MNKKVINVSKKVPNLLERFCDLLWANTPKNLKFHYVYQKDMLYVSIATEDNTSMIDRAYTHSAIKERKDDLFGLAQDCAEEMIHSTKQK